MLELPPKQHMMEMEHDMNKLHCMKDSDCMSMHQIHHPDHMMEIDYENNKDNYKMLNKNDNEMNKY